MPGRVDSLMGRVCPRCRYDLAGLPDTHVCPECGFEYDPHAKAIRLQGWRLPTRHRVLILLGFVALTAAVWLAPISVRAELRMTANVVLFGLLGLFMFLRKAGAKGYLLVNRHGVEVQHPDIETGLIEWGRVATARYSWKTGRLTICDANGHIVFRCDLESLGSAYVARTCEDAINRAAELYRSAHAPEGSAKC